MTFTGEPGQRLDHFLQTRLPEHSRSRIQQWIKAGRVTVDGTARKASYELRGGEAIDVEPAAAPPLHATPEDLPLTILYEDASVIAIDKPAGMVVHSGAGAHSGTLVNALLHRFEQLSTAGGEERPGIVHRLDKGTSGVILVARNDAAHRHLADQFVKRKVEKIYLALAHGKFLRDTGHIDAPISRDPVHRTRMTARLGTGRAAITDFRVLRRFDRLALLEVRIGTGRTHQIRVHLASVGHSIAGDALYGAPKGSLDRVFLHAHRIAFVSPATRKAVTVESPLAPELAEWLGRLE